MKNKSLFILLITAVLYSFNTHSQNKKAQVDSLMTKFSKETPGAVIGVYKDGNMIFSKAYGLANLTHEVPNTVSTKFNLGSASKQFAAFAITLLASRDSLSLEDPVRKYIPELPEFNEEVTIRHLLTHTSGYRETYVPAAFSGRAPDTDLLKREGAIEVVKNQPELQFPAGSEFEYNSSGYVLLSEIVERVTEMPYQEWMNNNVFKPLDMNNSENEMEVEQVIKGAADSYFKSEEGTYITDFSNRAYYGAADLYTNLDDLGKWFDNFKTAKVGGEWVQKAMRENYVFTNTDTSDYALGLFVDEYKGLKRIWHSGAHASYRSSLVYYPEIDAGVAVLSNFNEVPSRRISFQVSDIFFEEQMEAPKQSTSRDDKKINYVQVDEEILKKYEGTYYAQGESPFTFTVEDKKPFFITPSGYKIPLVAHSDSLFQMKGYPRQLLFEIQADGTVDGGVIPNLDYLEFKEVYVPSRDEVKEFSGTYFSPELNTSHFIKLESDTLRYKFPGEEAKKLMGTKKDNFLGIETPVNIEFIRNEDGDLNGYYVSLGRARNIWFEKEVQEID